MYREIERNIFCKPVIDKSKYPEVSQEVFDKMREDVLDDYVRGYIFLDCVDNKPYIQMYYWDVPFVQDEYVRFVISEGYFFSEEDEILFDEMIQKGMVGCFCSYGTNLDDVINSFNSYYPQFSIPVRYCIEEIVAHMYYVLHPGPRGILFRDNLEKMAILYSWGELSECNILGDTSSAILYDIPLEMLKTMNNDMDMDVVWELMQGRGREMRKENT